MSLAKMLLEGTASNLTASEASRYSADEGAAILAMESAELLQDIFMESECKENEIVLNAALEGYAPDSEIVQEGVGAALKGALDKVIALFKKLKDGVVAFCKNIIKYLDKLFLSGKEIVKKYKNELTKKELDGLTYTRYKYNDDAINAIESDDVIKGAEEFVDGVAKESLEEANKVLEYGKDKKTKIDSLAAKKNTPAINTISVTLESNYNKVKEEIRQKKVELLKEAEVEDINGENPTTSGLSEALLKAFRGGAESEEDKEELDVDIKESISIIEKSSSLISSINSLSSKMTSKFNKGIKDVEKVQREADKLGTNNNLSYISKQIGLYADSLTFSQNIENIRLTAWKTVVNERYKVHTSIVKKALTYKPKKD